MKETHMLLGLGVGMIAGALLYKYSTCAKKLVDNGEKKVIQEVDNIEEKMKETTEKLAKKVK